MPILPEYPDGHRIENVVDKQLRISQRRFRLPGFRDVESDPENAGSFVQPDPLRHNRKLANDVRRVMRYADFQFGMSCLERLAHL